MQTAVTKASFKCYVSTRSDGVRMPLHGFKSGSSRMHVSTAPAYLVGLAEVQSREKMFEQYEHGYV
jgi:hypothetical protein